MIYCLAEFSFQFSHVQLFATPWTIATQASLSFSNSQSLLKLMSIESVMPSNHLILCRPFSSYLQSFPASGSFPIVSSSHQMAEVLEFSVSASVLPMNIQDWFPLGRTGWISLLYKGLLSLLQQHSSKASILQHSAFFIVQLSHLYMTTGKTIALTRQTFVGKVMSLLFNMVSRLIMAFLPMNKCLLISWLQSPSAVILEPPKIQSITVSIFPHLFAMKWLGQMP